MTITDPVAIATDILGRISTVDSTAPIPSEQVIYQWSEMIRAAGVSHDDLVEGVVRVYTAGGEPPRNKIGAVLEEAKAHRRVRVQHEDAQARANLRELPTPEKHTVHGPANPNCYRVDQAITMQCPVCGAGDGQVCKDQKFGERRIPHVPRLQLAYRHNNPNGKLYKPHRRHETPQTTQHPNQAA